MAALQATKEAEDLARMRSQQREAAQILREKGLVIEAPDPNSTSTMPGLLGPGLMEPAQEPSPDPAKVPSASAAPSLSSSSSTTSNATAAAAATSGSRGLAAALGGKHLKVSRETQASVMSTTSAHADAARRKKAEGLQGARAAAGRGPGGGQGGGGRAAHWRGRCSSCPAWPDLICRRALLA